MLRTIYDPGGGGDPVNLPDLTIEITQPLQSATISGAQSGQAITVQGTVAGLRISTATVAVTVTIGSVSYAATVTQGTWQAQVYARSVGVTVITADVTVLGATTGLTLTASASISVNIPDTVAPHVLQIAQPSAGAAVDVAESGSTVLLRVRAEDYIGIASVQYQLDSGAAVQLARDPADARYWTAGMVVSGLPLGTRSLKVRCLDLNGNAKELSSTFTVADGTPPTFAVLDPPENAKILAGSLPKSVKFSGSAADGQTGVSKVEWSLNGTTFTLGTVTNVGGNNHQVNWEANASLPDYGFYQVVLRFSDAAGKTTTALCKVEIVSSYKPKDAQELLSDRAYLDALLAFTTDHVRTTVGGVAASTSDLQTAFSQPFGKLKEPLSDVGSQPVNRLRIVVEALRKYPKLLSARWKCEEQSGTALGDSSSFANAGALSTGTAAASFVSIGGRRGISFTGAAGCRATVPNSAALEVGKNNADFSVTFWLYMRQGFAGSWRVLLHKCQTDTQRTFAIYLCHDSNRIYYRISTATSWDNGGTSTAQVALNTWTHLAYVKEGSRLSLYINGVLDSGVDLSSPTVSNSGPLYVGADATNPGVNGCLADIRVYRFALAQSTVAYLAAPPASSAAAGPQPVELDYNWAAYDALLGSYGTSYEELQLAAAAARSERESLAARLGMVLDPQPPDQTTRPLDHLDDLLPSGSAPSESWLEQIFGLANTNRSVTDPPAPKPLLLQWQELGLKAAWNTEDHALLPPGSPTPPPIIDPDLIGPADLADPTAGNAAYDKWLARQSWVAGKRGDLVTAKGQQTTQILGFDAIVGLVLGTSPTLSTLGANFTAGIDVGPTLDQMHLSIQAFRALLAFRALAQANGMTSAAWDEVYDLLTQVQKVKQWPTWRTDEAQIVLGPDLFKIADADPALLAWRADPADRADWQDKLRARTDGRAGLAVTLASAVAAAEEGSLPLLRDVLVAGIAGTDLAGVVGDMSVDQLLIDVKTGGAGVTTRLQQAAETLQQVIFSLRTLEFDPGHPASTWVIQDEGATAGEQEANFDAEWRWISSDEAWRSISYVFLYPENYLLPSLREDQTAAFKTLVANLRTVARLTPQKARQEAATYLAAVRATTLVMLLPATFVLTDQLTKQDLAARYDLNQEGLLTVSNAAYVAELFYYVPMHLALELQKAGEFVAALDWFQTVYAYNLPAQKRKVYYRLRKEANGAPSLTRDAHWLRKATNPHTIAQTRPNPYTRFTLMSLVRCLADFGDVEFTRDTPESRANARSLYLTARGLLALPDLLLKQPTDPTQALLPNPALDALGLRVEGQLAKLRQERNIAGMKRESQVPGAGALSASPAGQAALQPPRPTPYHAAVLLDRSKQLVNIAQQIEGAYLAALERVDVEGYNLQKAKQDLGLAEAGVTLQRQRVTESLLGEDAAQAQRNRSALQRSTYNELLLRGISAHEREALHGLQAAQNTLSPEGAKAGAVGQMLLGGVSGLFSGAISGLAAGPIGAAVGAAIGGISGFAQGSMSGSAQVQQTEMSYNNLNSQIAGMQASYERREQEWRQQRDLANGDVAIGEASIASAREHTAVTQQEQAIAELQASQSAAMVQFLATKLLTAELYEWMSGVLAGVYRYFLQQATATAKLAECQLAFERQAPRMSFIQGDYWEAPASGTSPAGQSSDGTDHLGLTGSARLLRDIYQVDQSAFEGDRRKLNLSQTFSLSQLFPVEFQRFRATGCLTFGTPMYLFDQGFPGHYLRLIKRVRTSVVALVPPNQGIRATLAASGISRVVTAGDSFRETTIRRDPEIVALTAPISATGVFELDAQSEMLLPFEAMGVDTSWEFQMPRAANPFDFSTVADVLITIEYTALNSLEYRQRVIHRLASRATGDRAFSLCNDFPDVWYALSNPADPGQAATISFDVTRADFPVNLDALGTEHLLLYYARGANASLVADDDLCASLSLTQGSGAAAQTISFAQARPDGGMISTRHGDGKAKWSTGLGQLHNQTPAGKWTLTLGPEANGYIAGGAIQDVLFVISYSGRTPSWPA